MNSNLRSLIFSSNGRKLIEKSEADQDRVRCSSPTDSKQFSPWITLTLFGLFVLFLIGWFWIWIHFIELRWLLIDGVIAFGLIGVYPLTYIAYLSFSTEAQRSLLKNDFRLLGLVSEEELDKTVKELYLTVYSQPQFIAYIGLIVIQSLVIFAGYLNRENLIFINSETMTLIFYSYLGASIFSIQQVVRRYNTFDLQPQVYSSISVRIFMSAVITFVGASIIILSGGQLASEISDISYLTSVAPAGLTNPAVLGLDLRPKGVQAELTHVMGEILEVSGTQQPQPWAAILAFVIGIFPNRGIRWFSQQTNRILSTPTDQTSEHPLKNILGVSTWHEARLSEMGIDDAQNLATVDIRKLLLTTQFDTQEIIHWIDQAILYVKVGQKINRFRDAKIITFHEFRVALSNLSIDPLTTLTEQECAKRDEARKRLATVLGIADLDELDRLCDYSNFPNYVHIAEYYSRTAMVAHQQANTGMEILIGDLQETNFERAIENGERLLFQNPNNPIILTNLGVAYYELARWNKSLSAQVRTYALDKAYDVYTRAINYDDQMAKAYYNRSLIYIDRGEYQNAIQDCTRAIDIDRTNALAFNNRGLAYMHMGYLDRAIIDLNQALQLNDRLADAYYNRGYAYSDSEQGNFKMALKDFEKAHLLGYRGENLFWFRWGETLLKVKNFTEAIEKLSKAILHDSDFAIAYARRGYAYLQLGKEFHRQARNDFGKALDKITDQDKGLLVEILTNLGKLEARENKYEAAIYHYQEALKLDEHYHCARYGLAKVYEDNNQYGDAQKEFQHLVRTAPSDSFEAQQAYEWISRSETSDELN